MTEYFEIVSVPAIAAIVYTIIDIVKTATGGSEKFKRFIPLAAAVLGGLIGLAAYYTAPEIIGAQSVLVAIVVGAASGLTATGANQAVKQLAKTKPEDDNTKTE